MKAIEAMRKVTVDTTQQLIGSEERILVLAPSGRDASLAAAALSKAGLQAEVCGSIENLCATWNESVGAAIIERESINSLSLRHLEETISRQPAWSDLPIIILTSSEPGRRDNSPQITALCSISNTTLLERPLSIATLVSTVETALRARRRQYEVRDHLLERERQATELREAAEREQSLRAEAQEARDLLQTVLAKQQHIAETLQRALLPQPPSYPGIEISTQYEAAYAEAEVGGDFYDAFRMEGGKIALVLGDVVGKGLAAATHTAEVKYALRAILREDFQPATALERMNNFLLDVQRFDHDANDHLVALSVAVLDVAGGKLLVSVASSEPPLIIHSNGESEPVEVRGMVLGGSPKSIYETASLQLQDGDLLIMVTDGITEARQRKEFFGYEGLVRSAELANAIGSLAAIGEQIIADAKAYAGGSLRDDACILLTRWHKPTR